MANYPTGKGIYIWQLQNCGHGTNMQALVEELVLAKVRHVAVKTHNGRSTTYDPAHLALLPAFVQKCQAAGLEVWGWGYIYGISVSNTQIEATVAAGTLDTYALAGYIIDAEEEFKATAGGQWATAFVNKFRQLKPIAPLGLSSYRFPSYHPAFPFAQFLAKCDFHYPQMYWVQANNPGAQLQQSYDELLALKNIPYIPAGCGYCQGSWCPTGAHWTEFDAKARQLNLPGLSGWSLQHMRGISDVWAVFQGLAWGTPPPPTGEYVTRQEFQTYQAEMSQTLTTMQLQLDTHTHAGSGNYVPMDIFPTHRVNKPTGSQAIKGRGVEAGEELIDLPTGTLLEYLRSQDTSKYVRIKIGAYPHIVAIAEEDWGIYVEAL